MNERLYLQNFVDLLSEKHGMNKKDAEKFVKEFFLLIEEALEKDRSVKIKGLGTFKLVEVESRESVKVNTGERFQIEGYTKVSFAPDTSLRDIINKPFAHFETVVLNENTILEDTPMADPDDEDGIEEPVLLKEEEEEEEGVAESKDDSSVEVVGDADLSVEAVTPAEEKILLSEEVNGKDEVSLKGTKVDETSVGEMLTEAPSAQEEPTAGSVLPVEAIGPGVFSNDDIEEGVVVLIHRPSEPVKEKAGIVGPSQSQDSSQPKDFSQPKESKLSAEEIIARELAASTPIPTHERRIKRGSKSKHKEKEKSPVPFLIAIIVVVLLLCGGALLFIYYPDLFESTDRVENLDKSVGIVKPISTVEIPQDTIIERKTVDEEVTLTIKEEIAVVPESKKEVKEVKKEGESATKPMPFNPDSVNYEITGTKATYTIQEGETLTRVALRFYGTKALWPYIVKYNPDIIKSPNYVPYGTTIKIPELVKK